MAKTTHVLGGSVRGRIGDLTLYVRGGQQIVYERKPRSKAEGRQRNLQPSLIMRKAWEWVSQLKEKGIVVSLEMMLKWLYAMRDAAATSTSIVLADEVDGAFGASRLFFSDGKLMYSYRGDYVDRVDVEWGTGMPSGKFYLVDSPRIYYPDVCYWITPIAGEVLDVGLTIGRCTTPNIEGKRLAFTTITNQSVRLSWASNDSNVVYVRAYRGAPSTYRVVPYRVTGWSRILSTWGGTSIWPYMVIGGDGRILHLAALMP